MIIFFGCRFSGEKKDLIKYNSRFTAIIPYLKPYKWQKCVFSFSNNIDLEPQKHILAIICG